MGKGVGTYEECDPPAWVQVSNVSQNEPRVPHWGGRRVRAGAPKLPPPPTLCSNTCGLRGVWNESLCAGTLLEARGCRMEAGGCTALGDQNVARDLPLFSTNKKIYWPVASVGFL